MGGKGTLKSALLAAPLPPEYDRESGSKRIWDLIILLVEAGWKVRFLARHSGADPRYAEELRSLGVEIRCDPDGDDPAQALGSPCDIALVFFWEMAEWLLPHLRRWSPQTRVLVDSVDLHFLRRAREAFLADGEPGIIEPDRGIDYVRELNVYAAADLVLTVSDRERRLLESFLGGRRARVLRDCEEIAASPVDCQQRKGLLFVGNFRHRPNRDGLRFLCSEILPRLDSEATARHPLTVIGNALTPDLEAWAKRSPHDLRMLGWVPCVEPYLRQVRMTLVPLRFGAGTKRKLIQSLLSGTPAVSTWVGAEGLDLEPERHFLQADDAGEFAGQIERLLKDDGLWKRLARDGRSRLVREHSRKEVRRQLLEAIEVAHSRPPRESRLAECGRDVARHWIKQQYQHLVERIRWLAAHELPAGSRILVVSKGDSELLDLPGCRALHFPGGASGWAGFHPPDSEWAISHLEALREEGAQHLLIPATSFWWLQHYSGLRRHLESNCTLVADRPDACVVYALG